MPGAPATLNRLALAPGSALLEHLPGRALRKGPIGTENGKALSSLTANNTRVFVDPAKIRMLSLMMSFKAGADVAAVHHSGDWLSTDASLPGFPVGRLLSR